MTDHHEKRAREILRMSDPCGDASDTFCDSLWPKQQDALAQAIATALREQADEFRKARPLAEWHEDIGNVLWWRFPIVEPPYVGMPLCDDWPGYHTHWTSIAIPAALSDETP